MGPQGRPGRPCFTAAKGPRWEVGPGGLATALPLVFDGTLSHPEGICLSLCCHQGYNYRGSVCITPKQFAPMCLILASWQTLQWNCSPKERQKNKIFGLQNKSWAWPSLKPLSALPSLQPPCTQRVAEIRKEEHTNCSMFIWTAEQRLRIVF